MRIGFIGAGHIGQALARHFILLGHDVALSNSRGPETLRALTEQLGPLAVPVTTEQAAEFGDVVVVTVPLGAYRTLPAATLAGKVVIDTCNYYPQRDGQIAELDDGTTTPSELIAAQLPGADVVKAFNSIHFEQLAKAGRPAGDPTRRGIPIAGDNEASKLLVAQLIDQIGFDPVDAGRLAHGRQFDNGAKLYGAELTGPALRDALAA